MYGVGGGSGNSEHLVVGAHVRAGGDVTRVPPWCALLYRFESAHMEKVGSGNASKASSESEEDRLSAWPTAPNERPELRALVLSLRAAATDSRPESILPPTRFCELMGREAR